MTPTPSTYALRWSSFNPKPKPDPDPFAWADEEDYERMLKVQRRRTVTGVEGYKRMKGER